MDQFIVNIIHRPEMVPEYAEKVTGQGKAEDIGRKALLTESLDIFKLQQECAHKNGLKTTIQMTYASLFNDEAVALAKEHHGGAIVDLRPYAAKLEWPVGIYTTEELNALMEADSQIMLWAGIGSIGSVIGVAGIPIFAYLLVQGVEHTSSLRRYALSVPAFAVISEVPYDLAMTGQLWDWSEQNSLWTVFIALVMLWLMKRFQGSGMVPLMLCFLFAAAGCFWAILLRCKFGAGFVLIAAILYLLRERKGVSYGLGALVSLIYAAAPLGFVPAAMCSGQRQNVRKYAFYALYPAMLALFVIWGRLLCFRSGIGTCWGI